MRRSRKTSRATISPKSCTPRERPGGQRASWFLIAASRGSPTIAIDLRPDDVVLQFAPLAFDASTLEIWSPLLNGAALAILGAENPGFGEIDAAIERHGVTTAWFTASLFRAIVDRQIEVLRPLRQLIAGGDVLSPRHVRRVRRPAGLPSRQRLWSDREHYLYLLLHNSARRKR
jgi:non-ribosomal peptide synthetase component F